MANFRFLDDTTAQRQLGVDRITFEQFIKTNRLKVVSRAGENIMFFRAADVAALRAELQPETEAEDAEYTAAIIETAASATLAATLAATAPATKRKKVDPAMRVHVRIQSDLKWYDVTDADAIAWFHQLRPEGYERNKENFRYFIARYQRLLDLIQSGEKQLAMEEAKEQE